MTSPFRKPILKSEVKHIVVNGDGAVGWFDSLGKYHADPAKVRAVRMLQIEAPDIRDMREVVNLEKNGYGKTVFVEIQGRDWFN